MKSEFRRSVTLIVTTCAVALSAHSVRADESGVGLYLPGQYGSLAAVPTLPGWSFASVYYHMALKAGGDKSFPRGGRVEAGLDVRGDLIFGNLTYTFATPVLGAQVALGVTGAAGNARTAIDATLSGINGIPVSGSMADTISGIGDLYPKLTMKWNYGVHNFMTYQSVVIPTGAYNPNRIANLGAGHGGLDGGVGYTFFNPATGYEFSVVTGLTYNFRNKDTDYKNGLDWHIDWAASRFLSPTMHIGVVGYLYQQISDDTGSGATAGPFRSRVAGIGPQLGFVFPVAGMQGYLNLKGYKEFAAENRPEGYNVWLTFALSPAAAPQRPR